MHGIPLEITTSISLLAILAFAFALGRFAHRADRLEKDAKELGQSIRELTDEVRELREIVAVLKATFPVVDRPTPRDFFRARARRDDDDGEKG